MGTRLTFDDLHVSPPVRPFHLPTFADDDDHARSPPRVTKPPLPTSTRTPGLLGRTPGRTPGTVSFHPEVFRRHGPLSPQDHQQPLPPQQHPQHTPTAAEPAPPATPSPMQHDVVMAESPAMPSPPDAHSQEDASLAMEEALHTLRARVRPPGMPLPQLFHNLFPAPRGFLNRESLWDELVRLFDLEEEVTWLACCAMDPNGMGLDFAAFAAFMQQAPSDDEYPFVGTPTPHRTPQLATARRRQRQQFSAVKAVPPPLTPQWLPRVFAHADEHGDKATASNLTSSLVPSDEAITTWQQYTQQGLRAGAYSQKCGDSCMLGARVLNGDTSMPPPPPYDAANDRTCVDHLDRTLVPLPADGVSQQPRDVRFDRSLYSSSRARDCFRD